jgi:hypothetical protein
MQAAPLLAPWRLQCVAFKTCSGTEQQNHQQVAVLCGSLQQQQQQQQQQERAHLTLVFLRCCVDAVLQFSQQQGNRCRSVLSFVAKESVDLLIIGLYKANSRRKGLALKGNALALASR